MKSTIKEIKSNLRDQKDEHLFKNFITNYASREERHYCAYLFAWLINDKSAIKSYFESHENNEHISVILTADFTKTEVYFEYTALRELIDLIGKKVKTSIADQMKSEIKEKLKNLVFVKKEGDIQKKKPDLVFYFPDIKTLVLVEAKFEMDFDEPQIDESQKYGNVLMQIFENDIKIVYTTVLGIEYQINKLNSKYPSISWEKVFDIVPQNGRIQKEIKRGLIYQESIHPKTMTNLKIK
jgi:hypothetical protein